MARHLGAHPFGRRAYVRMRKKIRRACARCHRRASWAISEDLPPQVAFQSFPAHAQCGPGTEHGNPLPAKRSCSGTCAAITDQQQPLPARRLLKARQNRPARSVVRCGFPGGSRPRNTQPMSSRRITTASAGGPQPTRRCDETAGQPFFQRAKPWLIRSSGSFPAPRPLRSPPRR
jgi:hypothetical protein